MKKVLHYVAIMNRGGQETFVMNVFRTIDRKKISFDFLCMLDGKGDYDEEIIQLGGKIHHIQLSKRDSKLKQADNFVILYKFLKAHTEEYEAFHVHTQHAMDAVQCALAAKLAGIRKIIIHSHSTSTLFHNGAHKFFRPILRNLAITRFACSREAGIWLYGKERSFEVINNGVQIERFKYDLVIRDRVRNHNGWQGKVVVGHVGNFTYPKNHEFLIRIFNEIKKNIPSAILVMVGTGQLMEDTKRQVFDLEISEKVYFLGGRSDVNELLQGFDILVFPSRYEGLPVGLVEAQCAGLSCVISDVITSEIDITENVYRLSLQDSVDKWAQAVVSILSKNGRIDQSDKVHESGFDILTTTQILSDIYLN